jgi:integrase
MLQKILKHNRNPNLLGAFGLSSDLAGQVQGIDPRTKVVRRHHVYEQSVQRAVKQAIHQAGIVKHAGCHTFRHSFATHLLEDGYDIRKDVKTTMIYTHVLNRGGRGVRSPLNG